MMYLLHKSLPTIWGGFIQNIPPMQERVEIMDRWWRWKKEHVLPAIMREQKVDMWIIRNNEAEFYYNNEGPFRQITKV